MTELILTVNSPGEVATWLTPVVKAVRQDGQKDLRITVFVLPCTYASGTEEAVIRQIPGIDRVISPKASWGYVVGRAVRSHPPATRRLLLFLGGEFALAARLARRFRCPAVAYTEGYMNSSKYFDEAYVPTDEAKERVTHRGLPSERVHVVGNLMVDAARLEGERATDLLRKLKQDGDGPLVALMPGSRPAEVRRMLPLLLASALLLAQKRPDLRFVLVLSRFVSDTILRSVLDDLTVDYSMKEGLLQLTDGTHRVSVRSIVKDGNDFLAATDLALTIPGSNTAELAVWGVPMIVCLPLQFAVEVPLDGVAGLVDRIPVVGQNIKRWAVRRVLQRTEFTALPNRVGRRLLVPELRDDELSPPMIADHAYRLLEDDGARQRMAAELQTVFGPPGAAVRIAERVRAHLEGKGSW